MTEAVVLTARDCHLCEDALDALHALGVEFPLRVREVDMESIEGRALLRLHRPAMPPAVLLDGVLFSAGRLPRRKLRRLLERAA
jgi:hypothetical protein